MATLVSIPTGPLREKELLMRPRREDSIDQKKKYSGFSGPESSRQTLLRAIPEFYRNRISRLIRDAASLSRLELEQLPSLEELASPPEKPDSPGTELPTHPAPRDRR